MSLGVWIGLGLLGGVGAVARFLLDGLVTARLGRAFPYGIFVVNVGGAFALGLLVGSDPGTETLRLLGVGLLGAFTTFSTWMLDTVRLAPARAVANLAASLALGLALAHAGRALL